MKVSTINQAASNFSCLLVSSRSWIVTKAPGSSVQSRPWRWLSQGVRWVPRPSDRGAEPCQCWADHGLPHPVVPLAGYGAIAKGKTWQATEQNPHPRLAPNSCSSACRAAVEALCSAKTAKSTTAWSSAGCCCCSKRFQPVKFSVQAPEPGPRQGSIPTQLSLHPLDIHGRQSVQMNAWPTSQPSIRSRTTNRSATGNTHAKWAWEKLLNTLHAQSLLIWAPRRTSTNSRNTSPQLTKGNNSLPGSSNSTCQLKQQVTLTWDSGDRYFLEAKAACTPYPLPHAIKTSP